MANICDNYITITGNKENLQKVAAFWKKELIDEYDAINYLCELSIFNEKERASKNIDVVSCKWIDTIDFSVSDDEITITCDSAWSPPDGLLFRMAQTFDVEIQNIYAEPGCDFGGKFTANKDGYDDESYSYLKSLAEFDKEKFGHELEYLVENNSLKQDTLDEIKEYITDEEYDKYKSLVIKDEI